MSLLNWIYPPKCIACQTMFAPYHNAPRPWLCDNCKPLLNSVPEPYCQRCGHPTESTTCASCYSKKFHFSRHRAAFIYDDTLRDMIHSIKFRNQRQIAEGLGHFMDFQLEADFILPVPMHPSKVRSRGFNQAEVMARPLSKKLGIPIARDMVKRVKKTLPQSGLSAFSREQNLQGAFVYNVKKYGTGAKTVIIIDDIFTSGATMNACASVLIQNGLPAPECLSLSIAVKIL